MTTFSQYGAPQAPDMMRHLLCFRASETENEALARIGAQVR